MRIALLAPAGAMHRHSGSFGHTLHYAPLTLTTLAALVPAELEAEIAIYDETVGKIPLDLTADLVCITCITGTAPRCYAYADRFRQRGITVAMGGVHPTLMPEETLLHADIVMTGFSEQTFPAMLQDFQKGTPQRLYAQNGDYRIAGRPEPRRDLLKKRGYITTNTVEAIRGCSLPCTFCAYPAAFGSRPYKRPVREIVAEIERLPGRLVVFPDVNLIADRAFALELFRALKPLNKLWMGLATSNVAMDDVLIKAFAESGCKGVLLGLESVYPGSQAYVNKGVNHVDDYAVLMARLHHYGILVMGCFAFGSDEEDTSVFERTVEMVAKTRIDLPRYSILTPFPKTAYYRQLEQQQRIIEHDWAMYDVEHVVFRPARMSAAELSRGTEWAWRETYKLSGIAGRLARPHSAWLSVPLNLGYKGYADKFRRFTRAVMCDNSDITGGSP